MRRRLLILATLWCVACSGGFRPAPSSLEVCFGDGGGGGYSPGLPGLGLHPLGNFLDVFKRVRRASDVLPLYDCAVEGALSLTSDPNLVGPPGKMLLSQSRLALASVGIQRRDMFLVPTSLGGVCTIVTRGSYGCGGPSWGFWNPDDSDPYVFGVLPNDVKEVTVEIDGERRSALLGDNVFYFEHTGEVTLDNLRLFIHYEDGTVQQAT